MKTKTNIKCLVLTIAAFWALGFGGMMNATAADDAETATVRCMVNSYREIQSLMKKLNEALAIKAENAKKLGLQNLRYEATQLEESKGRCISVTKIENFIKNLDAIMKNPNAYAPFTEIISNDTLEQQFDQSLPGLPRMGSGSGSLTQAEIDQIRQKIDRILEAVNNRVKNQEVPIRNVR